MNDLNKPEYLDDNDPKRDYDFFRQDHGGVATAHNGVADRLLQNDALYNSMKGDWQRTDTNKSGNIKVTTGREDGKFFIKREQNVDEIIRHCREYRAAALVSRVNFGAGDVTP